DLITRGAAPAEHVFGVSAETRLARPSPRCVRRDASGAAARLSVLDADDRVNRPDPGGLDSRPLPAYIPAMAKTHSFDITTGVDLQEVDNAVNQARKEIGQRYDFKGAHAVIDFDRGKGMLRLEADDEFKMRALYDVLQSRLVRRGVPIRNLKPGALEPAALGRVRREIELQQGIPSDTAKQIARAIRDRKMKNVQV